MSNVPPSAPPPGAPMPPPVDPAQAVKGPAIALMVVGGLYIAISILSLLLNLLGAGLAVMNRGGGGGGMLNAASGLFGAIFGLCLGGVILFGAMKMNKLQNYGMAMAGTIAAMLPCTLCCIIGLPLGIWSLVVLMKPEVKAAFGQGGPPGFPVQ